MVFEPIMLELAKRGHEVTLISHFPPPKNAQNVTYVDVNEGNPTPLPNNKLEFEVLGQVPVSLKVDMMAIYK